MCVLERGESGRAGQQAAQHNRSRHTNTLVLQIELGQAILAQRGERDAAEVGQRGVLEHHLGQTRGAIASDVVEADAA